MQKIKSFLADISSPRERRLGEQFAFGARETIIHSLNVDDQTFFLGTLQHGWIDNTFDTNRPPIFDYRGKPYVDLVWSARGQKEMKNAGRKASLCIGAPWSHLARRIEENNSSALLKEKNQGKVVTYFPSKSHHGWESFIDTKLELLDLDKCRYRVCLYWLDYLNNDLRKDFERRGFEVVCAGFRGSSGNEIPWADLGGRSVFLINLWKIIAESSSIIVDDVSSAFWYALSLNKPTSVLKRSTYYNTWNSSDLRNPNLFVQENDKILNRYGIRNSFDGSPLNSKGELTELARAELGWEFAGNSGEDFERIRNYLIIDSRIPKKYLENYREKFSNLFE